MFNWFKSKKPETSTPCAQSTQPISPQERLVQGLNRTRKALFSTTGSDQASRASQLEYWRTALIQADVGLTLTQALITEAEKALPKQPDPKATLEALKQALYTQCLSNTPTHFTLELEALTSILVVGINGAGKTTTIAKLAHHFKHEGHSVLLAAGDTYRAAAIEQLKHWGQRSGVPVIAQRPGADSASVIFDALKAAQARQSTVMIADTAGRLHTQHNLMEELSKIKRVMGKADHKAPQHTWLVLDGTLGQNALTQVKTFHDTLGLTGLIMTKLDGSAQGGMLLNIQKTFDLPILFIGVGEQAEDLQPFETHAFIEALLTPLNQAQIIDQND